MALPTKPDKTVMEAAKKTLNPKDVLRVVISETPELRDALLHEGLIKQTGEPFEVD